MRVAKRTERKGRRKHNSAPSIACLFLLRDPSAIGRFVVSVIVSTINCKCIGVAVDKSPVSEGNEFLPFSTNADASGPIVFKNFVVRVLASAFHLCPDCIEALFQKIIAISAVFGISDSCRFVSEMYFRHRAFYSEATARIRLALHQCIGLSPYDIAAFTSALSFGFQTLGFSIRHFAIGTIDGQMSENVIC